MHQNWIKEQVEILEFYLIWSSSSQKLQEIDKICQSTIVRSPYNPIKEING
jgi:hypothetical protein